MMQYSNKIAILDTNPTVTKNHNSSFIMSNQDTGNDIDITPFKSNMSMYKT